MTWMVAERLILLSLLTATRHEGLEADWEVNFEPRMTHTCFKRELYNLVEGHASYQTQTGTI